MNTVYIRRWKSRCDQNNQLRHVTQYASRSLEAIEASTYQPVSISRHGPTFFRTLFLTGILDLLSGCLGGKVCYPPLSTWRLGDAASRSSQVTVSSGHCLKALPPLPPSEDQRPPPPTVSTKLQWGELR